MEDEIIKMQQAEHQTRLAFMEAEHTAKMQILRVELLIAQVNLQKAIRRTVSPGPLSPLPSNPVDESPSSEDESD